MQTPAAWVASAVRRAWLGKERMNSGGRSMPVCALQEKTGRPLESTVDERRVLSWFARHGGRATLQEQLDCAAMQQGWLFLRLTEISNDAHEPNHSVGLHPHLFFFFLELGFFPTWSFVSGAYFIYITFVMTSCTCILLTHLPPSSTMKLHSEGEIAFKTGRADLLGTQQSFSTRNNRDVFCKGSFEPFPGVFVHRGLRETK
jgi:hypothetical protein